MENNYCEVVVDREYIRSLYMDLLVPIIFALTSITICIIEIMVFLDVELTRPLTHKVMWVGSVLCVIWFLVTTYYRLVGGFHNKKRGYAILNPLLFILISFASISGIYIPTFHTLALSSNVLISTLFMAIFVMGLSEELKYICGVRLGDKLTIND